jgi:hypothetical protein
MLKDVEFDGLGKGSALANSHNIAFRDGRESWGAMDRHLRVALLETVEGDKVIGNQRTVPGLSTHRLYFLIYCK